MKEPDIETEKISYKDNERTMIIGETEEMNTEEVLNHPSMGIIKNKETTIRKTEEEEIITMMTEEVAVSRVEGLPEISEKMRVVTEKTEEWKKS